MFNPGLYFLTLDLTKTKVLLNLGLESFVIQAIESNREKKQMSKTKNECCKIFK